MFHFLSVLKKCHLCKMSDIVVSKLQMGINSSLKLEYSSGGLSCNKAVHFLRSFLAAIAPIYAICCPNVN